PPLNMILMCWHVTRGRGGTSLRSRLVPSSLTRIVWSAVRRASFRLPGTRTQELESGVRRQHRVLLDKDISRERPPDREVVSVNACDGATGHKENGWLEDALLHDSPRRVGCARSRMA